MDTKDLDLLERAFAAEIDAAAKAALAMARNAWIAGQAAERERCAKACRDLMPSEGVIRRTLLDLQREILGPNV